LRQLAPKLEKATGDKLAITIGTANDLKDKIESGTAFDVAILTRALIDMLTHDGKVVPGSAANIAQPSPQQKRFTESTGTPGAYGFGFR